MFERSTLCLKCVSFINEHISCKRGITCLKQRKLWLETCNGGLISRNMFDQTVTQRTNFCFTDTMLYDIVSLRT